MPEHSHETSVSIMSMPSAQLVRILQYSPIVLGAYVCVMTLLGLGQVGLFDPWETHYAEVARQMVVRGDYIYPFWKSAYFFSKPILLFWLELPGAMCIESVSTTTSVPLACTFLIRLPVALVSLLCLLGIFRLTQKWFGRATALMACFIIASSPYWLFLSKQAITDMLFVGPTGLASLMVMDALFNQKTASPLPAWLQVLCGGGILVQILLMICGGAFLNDVILWYSEDATRYGIAGVTGIIFILCWLKVSKWMVDPALHGAAFLFAFSTLGKGPHGVVFAGLVVLLTLCHMRDFRFLRRRAVWTAAGLYVCLIAPWFLTMAVFDGHNHEYRTWIQRYLMHDLLGRVGGVHGDRGGFEYYLKALGFGVFPWLPLHIWALCRTKLPRLSGEKHHDASSINSTNTRVYIWFWLVTLFIFFTYTTTKFHHYIAPIVVPASLLTAIQLKELLKRKTAIELTAILLITLFWGIILRELVFAPWEWMDLFTYHYKNYKPDYYFPKPGAFKLIMSICGLSSLFIGLIFYLASDKPDWIHGGHLIRRFVLKYSPTFLPQHALVFLFGLSATVFSIYGHTFYYVKAGAHWTQRDILEQYVQARQSDKDRLIAFQMDWKGETFDSRNQDIQVRKKRATLLKAIEQSHSAYILVQRDRYDKLANILKPVYANHFQKMPQQNTKWVLVRVDVQGRQKSLSNAVLRSAKKDI